MREYRIIVARSTQFVHVGCLLAALVAGFELSTARADEECGEMHPEMDYGGMYFGPYDYRDPLMHRNLVVVERHHFTSKVATLRGGNTSATPGGDIQYTLRAFPNHHRALEAASRLADIEKRDRPYDMDYTVDCLFDRAMRWRPNDAIVRVLYGNYLLRRKRVDDALQAYRAAEQSGLSNPNLDYSIGLALFEKKDYEGALGYAHRAYEANYQLPGLRDMLKRSGHWRDLPKGEPR